MKKELRFEEHAKLCRNEQREKDEDEFNKSNRQSYASATKENKEEPSYTNSWLNGASWLNKPNHFDKDGWGQNQQNKYTTDNISTWGRKNSFDNTDTTQSESSRTKNSNQNKDNKWKRKSSLHTDNKRQDYDNNKSEYNREDRHKYDKSMKQYEERRREFQHPDRRGNTDKNRERDDTNTKNTHVNHKNNSRSKPGSTKTGYVAPK